ncbi:hypothetical protein INR75_15560 [Zunongwangia sp. SCSIO 43204]|uniref:hypothetical protein n=1 Tax=Zunongwangia sp. SCSIO 43204 TaxID=2779359 RepID=UPI001CA81769|nr:hypothetical protein [Zunongwangia sp. SCSIO 43204]UAB83577.1 hypothetical protein INR75_15560 [Zunongwangia sp. SCSIO 43204]
MSTTERNKDQDLPYNPEITKEDEQALNDKGKSMNKGQDAELDNKATPTDFTAENLDIPGRNEADVSTDGADIPDEENYQFNERGTKPEHQKQSEHPKSDEKI